MKTFITVSLILVLVAIYPLKAGLRKNAGRGTEAEKLTNKEVEEEEKISETLAIIENNFAKKMAVLQSFDSSYNVVSQNVENTSYNPAPVYASIMATVYKEVSESDFIYHYNYFKHSGIPEKYNREVAPVEPYVKAYVTYQAFLAAINFKVCELYYGRAFRIKSLTAEPSYVERANRCHELFMYLHWFTFSCIEEKARDFGNTETKRLLKAPLTRKRRRIRSLHTRGKTTLDLPLYAQSSSVSKAAEIMSMLDLDFIMDLDYLENENRVPREYKRSDGIVKWNAVPKAKENDMSENPLKALYATEYSKGKLHDYRCTECVTGEMAYIRLYDIPEYFKNEILILEDFFHTTITGSSLIADKRTISTLIPPYELSKKIWERLPDLMKIKNNFDPNEPRGIFGDIGAEMIRSNPAEIIRTILEMTAEYELEYIAERQKAILENTKLKNRKLANIEHIALHESEKTLEEDIIQIEQSHARIVALKAQPGCVLPRSDNSNVIDYYVTIDTTHT